LYWVVRRQLGRAAELACDAWVIETCPKARRAYAEALLAVCELVSRRAAPAPALGMGGPRQEIERRLTMILRESVPSRVPVRALFGVVLLALIALPSFTDGQSPVPSRTTSAAETVNPAAAETQDAYKPAVDVQEQRLRKLEATLEALLKEVKDLRAAGGKPPLAQPKQDTSSKPVWQYGQPNAEVAHWRYTQAVAAPAADQPLRLERVTYALPSNKAEALATLLKELKSPVIETQTKPDGIIVTTTPEAQRVVGEFVSLLHGKAPAAHGAATYSKEPAKK
jgi:hypothetical protein